MFYELKSTLACIGFALGSIGADDFCPSFYTLQLYVVAFLPKCKNLNDCIISEPRLVLKLSVLIFVDGCPINLRGYIYYPS